MSATSRILAFRFGTFEFDPRSGELRQHDRTVRLAPQPCRILTTLVGRAGQLVERDELRDALWSSDTFVDFDLGLNYCVNRLRTVLHDDARAAQFIETVPKRGYRFIAPVQVLRHPLDAAVAILPFENLNRNTGEEYLADCVTDALIDALAREPGMRVISRQSIQHLKGSLQPLPMIARQLGVEAVVEGSTLRASSRARVVARLVQAEPERHLWVDSYEGPLSDVLGLLSDVTNRFSEAIICALRSRLAVPVGSESVSHS